MILISCCHSAVLLLWFRPCWIALPNRLVTSEWAQPKALKEKRGEKKKRKKKPPSVWGRPTPTTTSSPLWGMSLPPSWKPWGLQGPVIYRSYLHMAKALRNIWQTGCFSLHAISPFLCRVYYIHTVVTPQRSAYGTWGIICQFLTCQGYFSYANFCLHGLFVSDVVSYFIPRIWVTSRGYVRLRVLREDGGTMHWWHGSEMERKGRKAGEERGDGAVAEWRIDAALLEARHRLRLTSLSLTDWWDYPDIFSF